MKLSTNIELSSFTSFRDILEGIPKILGVTCPTPRPLSEILYFRLLGRANMKPCTNLELSSFTGFRDILEDMLKIIGVT